MTCAEFLDRYTDFRDGLITAPRELRRFDRHLACCPSCRRYDATVRRGVQALQRLDTIEPSHEFRLRVQSRPAQDHHTQAPIPQGLGIPQPQLTVAAAASQSDDT